MNKNIVFINYTHCAWACLRANGLYAFFLTFEAGFAMVLFLNKCVKGQMASGL
jgi:hypothetical protein